jgi:hydrogenase maturation protein HypF
MRRQQLPEPAPARVLACGAWLKNTACLLDGEMVWMSPLHGDLGTPEARSALLESVAQLQHLAAGPIQAVAHDLHPDFFSTAVAQQLAHRLGVPAIAVQHHHAHIAQVQAQHATGQDLLGWALDGVGLGTDHTAWGGELLLVQGAAFERIHHLPQLKLPGGDAAAREPWRIAVAALHRLGLNASDHWCAGTLPPVPAGSIKGVSNMLVRGLNCPVTTSAGRWFDAVAGLLGVCRWQTEEAQAAIALEQLATQWLGEHAAPEPDAELREAGLNLDVLLRRLVSLATGMAHSAEADPAAYRAMQAKGAALFHVALADALAQAAIKAAQQHRVNAVALSGGCFFNRILRGRLQDALTRAGLTVHLPLDSAYGDAGLALGQAWVAAHHVRAATGIETHTHTPRKFLCV